MKAIFGRGVTSGLLLALAGCASVSSSPTEVTRFHLDQPIARGQIAVEPVQGDPRSIEFRTYADAVGRQLAAAGWTVVSTTRSEQVARVGFGQNRVETGSGRSPVSVGIGGSTGGWGSGVGAGISFPIGKRRSRDAVESSMSIRIQRRSDATVFWEGRARTAAGSDDPASSPAAAADKLASALFAGFPGESGRTISVP